MQITFNNDSKRAIADNFYDYTLILLIILQCFWI
jgi:hypothetical protein